MSKYVFYPTKIYYKYIRYKGPIDLYEQLHAHVCPNSVVCHNCGENGDCAYFRHRCRTTLQNVNFGDKDLSKIKVIK